MWEKRNLVAHYSPVGATLLHQNAFLDTFFLNLVHPVFFLLFLEHPATEHFLQPALLLVLLHLDSTWECLWCVYADLA